MRKPAITSLRRNLQAEYIQRLFDLGNERDGAAAMKPISNLAVFKLKRLQETLEAASKTQGLDAYSQAHIEDSFRRVTKWLDSQYTFQTNPSIGGVFSFGRLFGDEPQ